MTRQQWSSLSRASTTSKKLWLGFGTLTALLVLSSVAIIFRVRSIEGQVGEVATARDLSAVANQLEINILTYALDVRAYLQTGEPKARQGAATEAAEVERHFRDYERLATTDRRREMAARFDSSWQELKNHGEALLVTDNRQPKLEDLKRLYDLRIGLEKLLDDEMQVEAVGSYDARKDAALKDVRTIVGFALILLIAGVVIAVVTSGTVGRGVVKGEKRLWASRERLRVTLASIGDAVISTDTEGRITYLNAVAESLTGWTNGEAAGQPLDAVFRIVNEDTRQPVESPATRALREGTIVGLANHSVLIAKDGTVRPIDDSAAPIQDEQGKVAGCVLIFRDVSQQRQAARVLEQSEARKTAMFETALDCIISINHEGTIIEFNAAAEDTFGHRRQDVLGRELAEMIIPPAFRERNRQGLVHYLATGEGPVLDQRLELSALRADGTEFPVELTVTRIPVNGPPQFTAYLRDITERKRAADAVKISEVRYRRLFESAKDGILILDADTARITDANPFIGELLGFSYAELLGKELWEIGLFKDIEESKAAVRELQEKRYIRYEDLPLETKAGRRIDVEFVSNVYDEGHHQVIQCNFRDITERKRGEQELHASEQRFRILFDLGPVAVFSCNHAGVIQNYNRRAAELWGREPKCGDVNERFCGSLKLYHPDGRLLPHTESPIIQVLRTGVTVKDAEVFIERPDGSRVAVIVTFSPLKTERGEITGAITAFYDITDRKRAEQALRESHARFEALFDASPVGMYLVDAELRIRHVSRKARPVFGDIGELIGRDFVDVVHILWPPESADEIVARFRHTLETGEPYAAPEFSEERYDRKVREYYDWQIHRIALSDGQYGVVCYFIDISARMQLSNELRQYAADLSEADRRKNEFLAMLAHELRNPLAPIRNAVQVLRLTGGNGEGVASASEIMERQVGQMVRLVDDLLDVSRISRGKIELRKERVELASVVHHAVEAARSLVQCMDHELTVTMPPHPIFLNADQTRLAQVVGNLLNNACKFTDKGGRIWLTVELASGGRQSPDDSLPSAGLRPPLAVIRVRDNGIGIAAEQLPRIFEMFTQLDTSLERSQSGLGIGLSLVKNLVEMHGGTVKVHSAGIGQGSEFVVRLPIFVETLEPPSEPTVTEPTTTTASRILVVDDNRDSATSLAMLLELSGNETHTAHDGLEAVQAAATFRPDVILLDIGLPKLNGYEAARKIREQPWGKGMVLVALTGWGQDEDRQKSKEAGFNGHMVKPVDHAALTKLLAELLPVENSP